MFCEAGNGGGGAVLLMEKEGLEEALVKPSDNFTCMNSTPCVAVLLCLHVYRSAS